MKTSIKYSKVHNKELSREEIDQMVRSMVLDMCNILLNEEVVQHRDEARVLLATMFHYKTDIDTAIVRKAKEMLDSEHVVFEYESGSRYSNRVKT